MKTINTYTKNYSVQTLVCVAALATLLGIMGCAKKGTQESLPSTTPTSETPLTGDDKLNTLSIVNSQHHSSNILVTVANKLAVCETDACTYDFQPGDQIIMKLETTNPHLMFYGWSNSLCIDQNTTCVFQPEDDLEVIVQSEIVPTMGGHDLLFSNDSRVYTFSYPQSALLKLPITLTSSDGKLDKNNALYMNFIDGACVYTVEKYKRQSSLKKHAQEFNLHFCKFGDQNIFTEPADSHITLPVKTRLISVKLVGKITKKDYSIKLNLALPVLEWINE